MAVAFPMAVAAIPTALAISSVTFTPQPASFGVPLSGSDGGIETPGRLERVF